VVPLIATLQIVIKVFLTRVVRWVKMFTGNSGYISTSRLILEGELAAGTTPHNSEGRCDGNVY